MQAVSQLVTDIQYTFSQNSYLACFFVDLKEAFDMVDLNIITENLTLLIYKRDYSNKLHRPREVNHGIPQGALLSPLLFNAYSYGLHNLFDSKLKVMLYVDDFCFYTKQSSYDKCVKLLKYITFCPKMWCNEHAFTISFEKSAVVFFMRHRIDAPYNIVLSSEQDDELILKSLSFSIGHTFNRYLITVASCIVLRPMYI